MNEILGKAKTIRELLNGTKYSIDYYQREYRWQGKQLEELIDDLTEKFQLYYRSDHIRRDVENYGHYYLGSIIITQKDYQKIIIDGQQRLTTLTLLLIYLHNLQKGREDAVSGIEEMIYSEEYGDKSFNIDIEERESCMMTIFKGEPVGEFDDSESNKNIRDRFDEIHNMFPAELKDKALPYFIDWLKQNVHLVEITAKSDEDSYTIFETMNDRGMSLTPTEMLKGYLLSNIDPEVRDRVNNRWNKIIQSLNQIGKGEDADFFKAWLRSQKANSIREPKKDATPGDFDRIGTEFHRWIRDKHEDLGLLESSHLVQLVEDEISFYAKWYKIVCEAAKKYEQKKGIEHIFFNAQNGFTQQYQLLLASLCPRDSEEVIYTKLRMVSIFIDILLTRRIWNFKSLAYSTLRHRIFDLTKKIRGKTPDKLEQTLNEELKKEADDFDKNPDYYLHGKNRKMIRLILARIIGYLDKECCRPGDTSLYIKGGFEIEHIWANRPDRHDELDELEFHKLRNRLGGLLLLPKRINAGFGDITYEEKREYYLKENILAQTLCDKAYDKDPGLRKFKEKTSIKLRPHAEFKKADLMERQALYLELAKRVWNPELISAELQKLS